MSRRVAALPQKLTNEIDHAIKLELPKSATIASLNSHFFGNRSAALELDEKD